MAKQPPIKRRPRITTDANSPFSLRVKALEITTMNSQPGALSTSALLQGAKRVYQFMITGEWTEDIQVPPSNRKPERSKPGPKKGTKYGPRGGPLRFQQVAPTKGKKKPVKKAAKRAYKNKAK